MKEFSKEVYLQWYKDMEMWRRFEDKCRSLYLKQKIRGFLHLYNGQEAIPAGFAHAMDLSRDSMITAYRCHILPMAMGVDPKRILAELCGKATGTSGGMGGSMHIFSKEHRFYGGHGIVGGQIPLGAGVAFADKYFGTGGVNICFFGDGAANHGRTDHLNRLKRQCFARWRELFNLRLGQPKGVVDFLNQLHQQGDIGGNIQPRNRNQRNPRRPNRLFRHPFTAFFDAWVYC